MTTKNGVKLFITKNEGLLIVILDAQRPYLRAERPLAVPQDKLVQLAAWKGQGNVSFELTPYQRATLLLVILAQLLAAQQPRGGPFPRGRPGSARLPRRRLPPHGTLAGRRPRG